jgi:hypothetical protein
MRDRDGRVCVPIPTIGASVCHFSNRQVKSKTALISTSATPSFEVDVDKFPAQS